MSLNCGICGTIRMHQERNCPGRGSGMTLENPDFVMPARSCCCRAERAERTGDVGDAIDRAISSETGAVLEPVISSEALAPCQAPSQLRDAARGLRP